MNEQVITLAAVCQAAHWVQKLARNGQVNEDELAMLLKSVMETSPENTLAVYGGDVTNLKTGLKTLIDHLGNDNQQKDPELTRYVVSLLGLERRLMKKSKALNELGDRIQQSQRQLTHYEITSDTLTSSLASIYSDVISPLGAPIQVAGNPEFLKQPANQHKIRALLLAGIRSAVLWRQVGGKRRSIIFSRAKIVATAQHLLNSI